MQMRHNANVTKYKCDKMQIRQNAKIPYINNPKYKRNSILGVPIENQCIKGGGLLYGGFGLFIFGIFAFCLICILSHLHFVTFVFCLICVLLQLHYVLFAFCYICNLSHLHFVTFAFCRVCILSGLHFVCFWRFVTFAFCQICILSRIHVKENKGP